MKASTHGTEECLNASGEEVTNLRNSNRVLNNLDKLKVIFWNAEGIRRINELSVIDIENIEQNHIICLDETWHEKEVLLPSIGRYSKVEQYATRGTR